MAEINIDAALVQRSKLVQKEEKLIKMENGCICCTLRGDLLEEVTRLAEQEDFDYLLIESTGRVLQAMTSTSVLLTTTCRTGTTWLRPKHAITSMVMNMHPPIIINN